MALLRAKCMATLLVWLCLLHTAFLHRCSMFAASLVYWSLQRSFSSFLTDSCITLSGAACRDSNRVIHCQHLPLTYEWKSHDPIIPTFCIPLKLAFWRWHQDQQLAQSITWPTWNSCSGHWLWMWGPNPWETIFFFNFVLVYEYKCVAHNIFIPYGKLARVHNTT